MNRIFITFFLCLFSVSVLAAEISIIVTNIEQQNGEIHIALFSQSEGFPDASTKSQGLILPIEQSTVTAKFNKLNGGEYAIAVFHDENNNHKLDTNLFGIPKEPYGFSGSHTGLAPPSFEQAQVSLTTDDNNVNLIIELR